MQAGFVTRIHLQGGGVLPKNLAEAKMVTRVSRLM